MQAHSLRSLRKNLQASRHITRQISCKITAHHVDQLVFPHSDTVNLEGKEVSVDRLIEVLEDSVTPERLEKMKQVHIIIWVALWKCAWHQAVRPGGSSSCYCCCFEGWQQCQQQGHSMHCRLAAST